MTTKTQHNIKTELALKLILGFVFYYGVVAFFTLGRFTSSEFLLNPLYALFTGNLRWMYWIALIVCELFALGMYVSITKTTTTTTVRR
jgi:hypothetical protein